MAAIIKSTVSPVAHPITGVARGIVTGASRDDLYVGDAVTLSSVAVATTYAWTVVYVPNASTATFSGDPTTQNPGSITIDLEGPYLVRLTVDLGLPTENTQVVRLRWLTEFAQLKLVGAGEENNSGIPIPVDQTPDGWTNEQNFNITTLKDFVALISSSGRLLYVDQNGTPADTTRGYGHHDTIQAAITDAVSNAPSLAEPWLVLVRPGLYTENLALAAHVHVYGWPGSVDGDDDNRVVRVRNSSVAHTAALGSAGDQVFLSNLTFENPINGTDSVINKTGSGSIHVHRCGITNQGAGATQGPALRVAAGLAEVIGSQLFLNTAAGAAQPALLATGTATVNLTGCQVSGPTGAVLEGGTTVVARDTIFTGAGVGVATGILTDADSLTLEYCTVRAPLVTNPLQAHPSAGALAGNLGLAIRWTRIQGGVIYDTTGVVGTTTLQLGSVEYTGLSIVGTPDVFEATVRAKTIFYDNTTTGIVAEDVQDAIDEVHTLAVAVQTLDDAYDGAGGGPGTGRTITADGGAVQIIGSGTPTDPPPAANTDGQLQVVSNVQVGAIGGPEIDIDPNPFGNGPRISMGRFIAANNAPFGSTTMVVGRSTGSPDFNNYNLRLQTESHNAGTRLGRIIVRGADALDNGGSTPIPGPVYVQAGGAFGGVVVGADVFLAPGDGSGAAAGSINLIRPEDATPGILTAAGAFVGGVAGTIRFATNMGAIEVVVGAGDNLAAVLVLFNATTHVTAIDSGGGVIELTTVATGPNAEIFFLNDTVGGTLDTALGLFAGQAQVLGTWPSFMQIRVTAANEVSFGVNGATGPMVYNADTGKLTVPGWIDPTALMLSNVAPIPWQPNLGTLFVGDGSGGTTLGDLYYVHEFGASSTSSINLAAAAILAGSIAAEDEGTPVGQFDTLDFTGPGVVASDVGGGKLQVAISGGGGASITVKDEGVSLGVFTVLNFVGANVQGFNLAGEATIYIPPPAFDSHWNTADGSNGDQSTTESISRSTARIATPAGGEGTPFNTGGWANTDQDATDTSLVTFTTPGTTVGFGGDSTMTVTVYDADGVSVLDSYTTPTITGNGVVVSPSGRITVAITSYAADVFRFKANAGVAVAMAGVFSDNALTSGGRYHVTVRHTTDSATDGTGPYDYTQSDVFYDSNPTTPSIGSTVTVAETGGGVATKHLSGIEYYITGSVFTVGAADIDQLNRNTARATQNFRLLGTEYGLPTLNQSPFGTGSANFSGWDSLHDRDNVGYSNVAWAITASNHRYIGPTGNVSAFPRDPWADGATVDSSNASILVDTYGTSSTNLAEPFNDEARRQDSGYNGGTTAGNWTSSTTLVGGEALVFGGHMMAPDQSTYIRSDGADSANADWSTFSPTIGGANPNYSALGVPVSHYRTIVDVAGSNRASFQMVFTGTFVTSATTDLANGDIEIYIRRRASAGGGDTGPSANPLELHGAQYNFSTFDDGVTDGKIREGSSSGNTVNGTFGGYSCETGFFIEVKIINAAIKLDRYDVVFF